MTELFVMFGYAATLFGLCLFLWGSGVLNEKPANIETMLWALLTVIMSRSLILQVALL